MKGVVSTNLLTIPHRLNSPNPKRRKALRPGSTAERPTFFPFDKLRVPGLLNIRRKLIRDIPDRRA